METDLTLAGKGLPPFSARGCHQILKPIVNGEYRRTIEGQLLFLGDESHCKYQTRIQGQDKASPALDQWWRGQQVQVGCIQRLCQEFQGDGVKKNLTLLRQPVEGSLIIHDEERNEYTFSAIEGKTMISSHPPSQGKRLFISYRPLLEMMVTHYTFETDEWGHVVKWSLELEEV